MKDFTLSLLFVLFISLQFQKCANPLSPTGGPKDTIPPTLIQSIPKAKELNYSHQEIILEFDELINADKLKNNLLITPTLENIYKHTIRKNQLTLSFEKPFQDSTTYTFNFFDGVTDITEKTAPENLILAFSTGPYIDSLSVSGLVTELLTKKPVSKMSIGLYPKTDTLDYRLQKPTYLTTTNDDGFFLIENIKSTTYHLFAFKDENRNVLFDASIEPHATYGDSLLLLQNIDSLTLYNVMLDLSPLKTISGRPNGSYFEVRYSKSISNHSITYIDTTSQPLLHHITTEGNIVRIYNTLGLTETDSLGIYLNAMDTIGQQVTDTLYISFRTSNRKLPAFTITSSYTTKDKLDNAVRGTFTFNKPISIFDRTLISFRADSSFIYPIDSTSIFEWNSTRTSLSVHIPFDWTSYSDSLRAYRLYTLTQLYPDSTIDLTNWLPNLSFLQMDSSCFISADQDTSLLITSKFSKLNPEDFGVLRYSLTTNQPSYIVQLIDKSYKVIQTKNNLSQGSFTQIFPGSYSIRVLIDSNNDGIWSPGNPLQNTNPEPVYLYKSFTDIKSNWEINIEDITF